MEHKQPKDLAKHYKKKLARKGPSNLESFGNDTAFGEGDVDDTLNKSAENLNKIIEDYFDNDPKLKRLAKKLFKEGGPALRAVANEDEAALGMMTEENNAIPSMLEVIVKTDGSRPSFLIKNDQIDFNSSPIGEWRNRLEANENIDKMIKCVGRVNLGQRQIGTGFLISENMIVTNRHVLQSIALLQDTKWKLNPAALIDFGHEFKAQASVNPRMIKRVVYTGPQSILPTAVDHRKLDMAILEIEPVPKKLLPAFIPKWDNSENWAFPATAIVTIGYPGDPGIFGIKTYTATLLDKLFKSTYGCKRLAPGEIMEPMASNDPITIAHDATTLGGNSGSLIMQLDAGEFSVCALHYGGESAIPRENWGQTFNGAWERIKKNAEATNELDKKLNFLN